ncbi:unnamed protein product [Aphanomyces euteiches]
MTSTQTVAPSALATMNEQVVDSILVFLDLEDVFTVASTSRGMRNALLESSIYWRHVNIHNTSSSCLRRLIPFAPRIRHLTLQKSNASEEAWIHFARHTKDVRVLDVSGSKHFTETALAAFADCNSSTLSEVYADNCVYVESLASLAQCAAGLRTLSFNRCRLLLTSDVLDLIGQTPYLHVLNLKGCPKINPVSILSVVFASCLQLRTLALGGSGRFMKDTNQQLSAAFSQDNMLALESLDISCSNPFGSRSPLSDDGLLPLLRSAPYLKALYLKGHSNLSRAVLDTLPRGLKILDLTGCTQLTANVEALSELKQLEELVMYSCPNVTDTTLHVLKGSNTNLIKVDFDRCSVSSHDQQVFA